MFRIFRTILAPVSGRTGQNLRDEGSEEKLRRCVHPGADRSKHQ
jgi:hypothetical protein